MNLIKKLISSIRSIFLSGLFTVIPIAVTVFSISFLYNFFSHHLSIIHRFEPRFLEKIPGSEFLIITILILTVGIIIKVFIVHKVINFFEDLIKRIPIIRIIYSSAKLLVDFFKKPDAQDVKRTVVLIPYPKDGQYHLAFLLGSADDSYEKILPDHMRKSLGERYFKVFMPNSPNPTSGYFFIMPESDIIHTDITFEEAVKTLVSCGLITPESLIKKDQGLDHIPPNE